MPIVTIQLMEGRDPAALEAMQTAVATAIADTIDAPVGTVRIMVNEMRPHQYSVGGEAIAAVKARRAEEAQAGHEAGDADAEDSSATPAAAGLQGHH